MPETNGLLSGKYDSTKQRAVLVHGDRLRNYRSYTATMRMELLLTGHLVFTDAQFFDGLYFHWLAANKNEFDAFKKLMVSFKVSYAGKEPLFSIAVKCRKADGDKSNSKDPDLEQTAVKMYCKQFQFSSIEHDDLAKAVFELSNDFSESYLTKYDERTWENLKKMLKLGYDVSTLKFREALIKKLEAYKFGLAGNMKPVQEPKKNLREYSRFLEEQLYNYKNRTENSATANWKRYTQKLETLFDIKGCANKWGARGDKSWRADYRLAECLDQTYTVDSDNNTYREKMEKLLDDAEWSEGIGNNPIALRYFARIRDEMNRNISNRSKITTSLDELERLNDSNRIFKDFRQLMNDRYNKALAIQHGCQFLDLCDHKGTLDKIYDTVDKYTIVIPHELVNCLANLSWKDFVEQMKNNTNALKQYFNAWMDAYKDFPSVDLERVKTHLKEYLKQLNSNITYTSSKENAAAEFAEPWDEAGTCDQSIRTILSEAYSYPCYFIGGGSFEASPAGNEICILCTGQDSSTQKDMAVLRLRFDEHTDGDNSLDTLLAPVCNPLNGGALPKKGENT